MSHTYQIEKHARGYVVLQRKPSGGIGFYSVYCDTRAEAEGIKSEWLHEESKCAFLVGDRVTGLFGHGTVTTQSATTIFGEEGYWVRFDEKSDAVLCCASALQREEVA